MRSSSTANNTRLLHSSNRWRRSSQSCTFSQAVWGYGFRISTGGVLAKETGFSVLRDSLGGCSSSPSARRCAHFFSIVTSSLRISNTCYIMGEGQWFQPTVRNRLGRAIVLANFQIHYGKFYDIREYLHRFCITRSIDEDDP